MDFSRKQYDSLSLRYYRGVISHKEILYEQDQFRLIRKCLRSKMPSLKFTLSNWLNYHKGFGIIGYCH